MEKKIVPWLQSMMETKDYDEFCNVIEEFELELNSSEEFEETVQIFIHQLTKIQGLIDKLPYVLSALYLTNKQDHFLLFTGLFLEAYLNIGKIEQLEEGCEMLLEVLIKHPINEVRFRYLTPTLLEVLRVPNQFAEPMWLILLKFAKQKELFDDEIKLELCKIVESTISKDYSFLKENNFEATGYAGYILGIVVDAAGYFPSEKTLDYIMKIVKTVKNRSVKVYSAVTLLKNNIDVPHEIMEDIASDLSCAEQLFNLLERNGHADKYPAKYANQEWIARSRFLDWLSHPNELGESPTALELAATIEKNIDNEIYNCYVFKFKSDKDAFKDNGWMVGICGGYAKGKLNSRNTGWVFSKFESLTDDGSEQGAMLVEFIIEYWKKRAIEM